MIALGFDPGTRRIGFGVVERKFGDVKFIAADIMDITATEDIAAIREIKRDTDRIIKKYKPDVIGVERLFFATNQKTAIAVAQARGVILLAAAEAGVTIKEYAPNEIKSGITGYGSADKKAVLKMVRFTLHEPDLMMIDDASDALAIAIMASAGRTGDVRLDGCE
jgi:crossover junction endodeoxyribonuclease RuvC